MLKEIVLLISLIFLSVIFIFLAGSRMNSDLGEEQPLHDYVTKQGGTEPAFNNEYWDEKRPGIYVDYNTGEALFSSLDKYDSGTGWPSFTKPINKSAIKTQEDKSLGLVRTEVKTNSSHLGHVFDDGPEGGERYCINSAALRFIPYEDLEKEGYEKYKKLFPYEEAVLAGGCFWGVEHLLQETPGVLNAVSGYTGGNVEDPNYEQVSSGKTGHAEAVLIVYNPEMINYTEILNIFWRLHNPTQVNRQGPDVGTQYRSAIFYMDEKQKEIAIQSKEAFDAKKIFNNPAATEIIEFEKFYKAEDYHQDYVKNHQNYVCHELREE